MSVFINPVHRKFPIGSAVSYAGSTTSSNETIYGTVVGYPKQGGTVSVRTDIDGTGIVEERLSSTWSVNPSILERSDHQQRFPFQDSTEIEEAMRLTLECISSDVFDYEVICGMALQYQRFILLVTVIPASGTCPVSDRSRWIPADTV